MKKPASSFCTGLTLSLLVFASRPSRAQTWTPTVAPSNSWAAIACSADGLKLIAATDNYSTNGQIYISGDGGTNWTLTQAPARPWSTVASTADGMDLFALSGEFFGQLYGSTNSGSTWALNARAPYGASIAISGDGEKLAIATGSDGIGFSTNGGGVWTTRTTGLYDIIRVVSSADGTMLAAANNAGRLTFSTNGGFNWSASGLQGFPFRKVIFLDSSANLQSLVAIFSSFLHVWVATSTNMGLTWRSNALPQASWSAATTSADGTRFVAVASNGSIYSSANAGVTWTSNNAPAATLASYCFIGRRPHSFCRSIQR